MGEIFGYRVSLSELIVALLLAMPADRIFRLTPKIWSLIVDFLARRSRRSRDIQFRRLIVRADTLTRDMADPHVQVLKSLQGVGHAVVSGFLSLAFLYLGLSVINLADLRGIEEQMNMESILRFGSVIPNTISRYIAATLAITCLILFMRYLFLVIYLANTLRIFLDSKSELERLNVRIQALSV
jgi:hypothetical protein